MNEALLIIWLSQSLSTTRYNTVEQCEVARKAIITDPWIGGWMLESKIHCITVPKYIIGENQ